MPCDMGFNVTFTFTKKCYSQLQLRDKWCKADVKKNMTTKNSE